MTDPVTIGWTNTADPGDVVALEGAPAPHFAAGPDPFLPSAARGLAQSKEAMHTYDKRL